MPALMNTKAVAMATVMMTTKEYPILKITSPKGIPPLKGVRGMTYRRT